MNKKAIIAILLALLATSSSAQTLRDNYDIIIAGAGTGGIAAAIQASRMDMNVLVIEPSSWPGGQATAAGVSTMDDLSGQTSGIYREFIGRVEDYYSARGKDIRTCYWDMLEVAFEPHIGRRILSDMLKGEYAPDILYNSEIIGVGVENVIAVTSQGLSDSPKVNSVIIKTPSGTLNIACKVLIDATEYGDILPLAGADYRAGNSLTPSINPEAMIQDITWTAVIRKYPSGIPEHLKPKTPLPGYERAKWNYERYVTKDGGDFEGTFPVKMPVNFITHNAYRGLPDSFLPGNYDSRPENWKLITKAGVNWGNDYPGYYMWRDKYGLPVAYLEDRNLRERVERDALIKTLHFIFYIQNELGESWSVDENEYNELPKAARDLPREWQEIAKHLPTVAYVRESRRGIAAHTYTSEELYKNSLSYRDGNLNNEFSNSIAIGCYPLDLHHSDTDDCMEHDLNEKAEYLSSHAPKGNFQVPLDILIPSKVDGLIFAEKNLSMSRIVSGALRLQPITMMTGQAAGALAALAVQEDIQPREVKPLKVQKALIDSEVRLSLCEYADVPEGHKYYGAIQLANLYRLLEPVKYPSRKAYDVSYPDTEGQNEPGIFGIDEHLTAQDMAMLRKNSGLELPELGENLTRGEAIDLAIRSMMK